MKVGIIIVIILVIISFLIAMMLTSGTDFGQIPRPFAQQKDVALIKIEGAISTEKEFSLFAAGGAVSDDIIDQIKRAEQEGVSAIYFEINSPGGTVVASEEIANAVKKTELPTVAFIREIGASGGYWAASAADYIIADPYSITGSIGVIGSYLSFGDFLKRYNITYEELKGGEYKDTGSPYKKLTGEEKAILQQRIDLLHNAFISEIAENRNMPYEHVKNVSTGIFYLGVQAVELGLVDQVGSRDDVEEYLKKLLNATEISYVEYVQPPGFFEALAGVMSRGFFALGKGIASGFADLESTRILA